MANPQNTSRVWHKEEVLRFLYKLTAERLSYNGVSQIRKITVGREVQDFIVYVKFFI